MLTVEEALKLHKGDLAVHFSEGCLVQVKITDDDVVSATEFLAGKSIDKKFYTQSALIIEAGKNGWGAGDVYQSI